MSQSINQSISYFVNIKILSTTITCSQSGRHGDEDQELLQAETWQGRWRSDPAFWGDRLCPHISLSRLIDAWPMCSRLVASYHQYQLKIIGK